jgi:metallo-beta-lactamase family protein
MAIAKLILMDSAKIQGKKRKANKEKYSKHEIAKPIYTAAQAENLRYSYIKMNELIPLGCEISALFTNAGHIIGACSIELKVDDKTLVFRRYWSR